MTDAIHTSETSETALPLRNDTFLGVCEAIGRDFGFNPDWLRIAFAAVFMASPMIVVGAYLGLGVLVAATRVAVPDKRIMPVKAAAALQLVSEQKADPVEERELIAA